MTMYDFLNTLTNDTLLVLFRNLNEEKKAFIRSGNEFDKFCEVIDYMETISKIIMNRTGVNQ